MVVTVIGARPQFVKAAVLSKEFIKNGIKEDIIHTGQHYDYKMSEVFFTEVRNPSHCQNEHIIPANQVAWPDKSGMCCPHLH